MLKSISCIGQITNTGGLEIIDKGFCFSNTESYPTKANSITWVVPGNVPADSNGYYFNDVITGLTEATFYWVNSYATNSFGIDYSDSPQTVTSGGLSVYPTISICMKNNGMQQTLYEMGTSSFLVISGSTSLGTGVTIETVFNNGYLNQTSSPQPSNPIKTWTGWQPTYTTASPSISVNFLPRALEPQSWSLKQDVFYDCGSTPYIISATTTIDSVFPFLWVLKNSIQNPTYFSSSAFYTEASVPQSGPTSFNGKVIVNKPDPYVTMGFSVTPNNISHKILILGYPEYYGNVEINSNGNWLNNPPNYGTSTVYTGGSIATPYSYPFKVFQYEFSTYSNKPVLFLIRFTT